MRIIIKNGSVDCDLHAAAFSKLFLGLIKDLKLSINWIKQNNELIFF